VPLGVNILGLTEILAFFGLLACVPDSLALLTLCAAFGLIALDLWFELASQSGPSGFDYSRCSLVVASCFFQFGLFSPEVLWRG
jgi:hypothetical protein